MKALLLALVLAPQVGGSQAPAPALPSPLCRKIERLTEAPGVARAHWGVSVASADGTPLCSLHASQLFRPASTNKIFTSAAALALLGPGKTFSTSVTADGTLKNGVLTGDLRLLGGGDANLGAEDVPYVPPPDPPPTGEPKPPPPELVTIPDIEGLADQIVAKGVRSVTGGVIGDDTYFAWQPYPPEWSADDLLYGYGAPISALSVHDNEVAIRVSQDLDATRNVDVTRGPAARVAAARAATARVTAETSPAVPWFTLKNTAVAGQGKGSCASQLVIGRWLGGNAPGPRRVNISGSLPLGVQHCGGTLAIDDPAEYAALALQQALERRGVHIAGAARAEHWDAAEPGGVFTGESDADSLLQEDFSSAVPQAVACSVAGAFRDAPPHGTVLATHTSPTLIADETATLKTSQNLHAELLLRNLGAAYSCDRTERGSLHVLRQYLLHAGVDPEDFVLYDGSGLSSHDLVAPRALTTFLVFAMRQPWFAMWRAALPVGGVDGTLHSRFKDALKGRVFAKTGTLGESSALAGYVLSATGEVRIFSIMVDNHTPMTSAHHAVVDQIVEAIAGEQTLSSQGQSGVN